MPTEQKKLTKKQKQAIRHDACLACCPVTSIAIGPLSLCLFLACGATAYYFLAWDVICGSYKDPDEKYCDTKSKQFSTVAASTSVICLFLSCFVGTGATLTQLLISCLFPNTTRLLLTPVNELVAAFNKTLEKHPLPFFKSKSTDEKEVPLLFESPSINATEMCDPHDPTTRPQKTHRITLNIR